MKKLLDHIERTKAKPHHVRKQIALAIAGVATGVVALIWLAGSLATGVFALKSSSFAESVGASTELTTSGPTDTANVAGAAAAPALNEANSPAHIKIIDAATPSAKKPESTTIPF